MAVTKFRRVVSSESKGGIVIGIAGFWGATNILFPDNPVSGTSMFSLLFL